MRQKAATYGIQFADVLISKSVHYLDVALYLDN